MLLQHPYHGIWHDSVLYLGQALAVLSPDVFRQDIFFAYGSQSSYTLVQYVLAPLVARFGASASFMAVTALALALFLLASWRLLGALVPDRRLAYVSLLVLIVLPGSYGAWNSLSYAEPFLTGRSLAEPLALLGLATLVHGRTLPAFAALASGALLNPLQVLPALVVAWAWLSQGNRRWLHLGWIAAVAAGAAALVPATQGLFTRMDPLWFDQVWQRNLVVFYSNSHPGDWYYLLTDVVLVAMVAAKAEGVVGQFCRSIATATLLLFTASLSLADWAHFAWPAGLQLWRVHWLLHWSAMGCLPWLATRLWRDPGGRARVALLASMVLAGTTPANAHPLVPGIALLLLAWPWFARRLSPPLGGVIACLCLAVAFWHLLGAWALPEQWGYWWPLQQWPSPLLQSWLPVVVPLLAIAVPVAWQRSRARARKALAIAVVPLVLAAALQWDQRTSVNRAFTGEAGSTPPFGVSLPTGSQVEWLGGLLPTWNLLHRPHYLDQQQLAGIVFNRATSMEGYRRRELLQVSDRNGGDCRMVTFPLEADGACRPDDHAIRQACERAAGELDYVVLPYRLHAPPLGTWSPLGSAHAGYHLYACRDMLAVAGGAPGSAHLGIP